jgi:hypothetical protein
MGNNMKHDNIYNVMGGTQLKSANPFKLTKNEIAGLKTATQVTLAVLGMVGMVSIAVIAPNLFTALDALSKIKFGSSLNKKQKIRKAIRSLYYLKDHGYISLKEYNGVLKPTLTELGRERLRQLELDALSVPKPARWNKKWWQVAADIPTKEFRPKADLFRKKLKSMGFCPLQKTLWYYPYDPRPQIEMVSSAYEIPHYVTIMEISHMHPEDKAKLLKHFNKLKIL